MLADIACMSQHKAMAVMNGSQSGGCSSSQCGFSFDCSTKLEYLQASSRAEGGQQQGSRRAAGGQRQQDSFMITALDGCACSKTMAACCFVREDGNTQGQLGNLMQIQQN